MDINEIRRARLRAAIDDKFDGVSGRMADAIGRPRPNVSGLLSGTRAIGEKLARDIELRLALPRGWLDQAGGEVPAQTTPVIPPELQALMASYQSGGPAKQAALAKLAALPEQEMALILLMLQSLASKYPDK